MLGMPDFGLGQVRFRPAPPPSGASQFGRGQLPGGILGTPFAAPHHPGDWPNHLACKVGLTFCHKTSCGCLATKINFWFLARAKRPRGYLNLQTETIYLFIYFGSIQAWECCLEVFTQQSHSSLPSRPIQAVHSAFIALPHPNKK